MEIQQCLVENQLFDFQMVLSKPKNKSQIISVGGKLSEKVNVLMDTNINKPKITLN
jgi:hypothetical protein